MTVSELKKRLMEQISPSEEDALRRGTGSLCISSFNRDVCLRLAEDEKEDLSEVSSEKIEALEKELSEYLDTYMQEKPEGHKWIIIACEYLTFAQRLPMHPQSAAKWTEKDGSYYCPSMEPGSITCSCCVCSPAP